MVRTHWGENTRKALSEMTDPVILLPVGTIEQHGSHLPVDTDTAIAEAIATAGAEQTENTLVLPALPFGYSPHHGGVPGTLSLSSETYLRVIKELLGSLNDSGFTRIIIVNGHGGNRPLLQTAVTDFKAERDISVAVVSCWDLIRETVDAVRASESGGISHGGEMETSLQLYLRKKLVGSDREDFIREDRNGYLRTDLFGDGMVYYPKHFDELTESGVSGHPSAASAEKGEVMFDAAVDALSEFAETYHQW